MPNPHRHGVIVLGMHRSGTSAVAGTAVRLGLTPPPTPLPASGDNPDGFYESLPVVEMNHRLLLAAGCAWNLCLTFEPEQAERMPGSGDRARIGGIVRQEFGEAGGFVLKDPRLCLTLPAWLPSLRDAGGAISVLIVIRHPAEVVRSLAARNGLEETETAPNWLHHMLEAERLTRGLDRAVVRYDDLLRDWRGCLTQAGHMARIAWPLPFGLAEREVERFLSTARRHHDEGDALPGVGPAQVREMIGAAWIALRRLADNPRSRDALICLDQVRARFAVWRREACPPGFRVVFPGA